MKEKILVVDDEKAIRVLLSRALAKYGQFQVEVAGDGEEALEKVEGGQFDLVLTDLKMPKMDGLELIHRISTSKPEILTVLMTGHASIDSAIEAMKRGASDYLTKPIGLEEMLLRLRRVLEVKGRFMGLKDYAAELERTNEELRSLDQLKSEFVSIASHELRTPLAAIKNCIQLVLRGKTGAINETQTKCLSMAERNINRLTNILNDLLSLSRIESGKVKLRLEEFNLSELLEITAACLNPQAQVKSIRLEVEVPENLPLVYSDREKVEQILTNLIGNAFKFTPEGGHVLVTVQPYQADREGRPCDMVAVSVKDSGIGIPKEHLDGIFEKFYQVEGSLLRSVGGTGLGLAITKGLVETLNGKIWVESVVEKGSTFTFTLPVSGGERREPYFRFILNNRFQHAQSTHTPLTLFLMKLSDQQGEMTGDLLDQLEGRVKKCFCRKTDEVLRRKTEKLVAVFCEADQKGGQAIQRRIEEEFRPNPLKPDEPWHIKIGFATYPDEALSKRELFAKSKERLRGLE
jgi:two-component system, sensor histidine kinase and response regulator